MNNGSPNFKLLNSRIVFMGTAELACGSLKALREAPEFEVVAAVTQPWEHQLTGSDIGRVAQRAEQLGYSMVFLPEHFFTPISHVGLSGNHYFDATTAQAFVAGATSTITVGSMVTILPLHNPVVAAKSNSVLSSA